MAVPYQETTDPRKLASNQRGLIQQRGDQLNQKNEDLANQAGDRYSDYQGFLDPVTEDMAAGNGGYTPTERDQIMQSGAQGDNYLTADEQAGIKGDTSSYGKYFNPDEMSGDQAASAGLQRQAAQNVTSRTSGAIDPEALKQSADYRARSGQQVANNNHDTWNTIFSGADNVRGAIGDEGSAVRGAIDPSSVTASSQFLHDYNMSPEEQQRIVTGAGISEGVKNQAAEGALQRQATAAGMSPEGVAAYRARMDRESAGSAGDAMTKARIAASDAAAQRQMSGEQLREQGGQYLTNTKVGSELNLGQQRAGAEQSMGANALSAQQHLGDQALSQQNAQEANRQAAEQYLTGAQLDAAKTGSEAELGAEQGINAQQRQQGQYNATQGTGIAQAQDQANSQRAGQVANNRQSINLTNQGNQSQRATTVANTRVGQQNVGLGLTQSASNTANQNQQNALNRQSQNYATQAGATNQAAGLGLAASQTPTTTDKVIGGITGAVGAAASFLDEGAVVTKPTLAVVGERGPEMVMPLDYRARAKARPSMAFGQEQVRRRRNYAEVA